MRKLKMKAAVLNIKIAELETMLTQDMVGQPAALWLKIKDALYKASAELSELRKSTTHKHF